MTAYEITRDLLDSTTDRNVGSSSRPARPGRFGRLFGALTAGVAAGAVLLAVPTAAAAAAPSSAPAHRTQAVDSPNATVPSTIVLTTRRTGSVIL